MNSVTVTDIHGKLYPTTVHRVEFPDSVEAISLAVSAAREEGRAVSIAGGRHAMGGQQFGSGTILLDMSRMTRILELDIIAGEVVIEAGIQWPRLIAGLLDMQQGTREPWSIIQKQTGADRLSLGGALSANVHGRGLCFRPIIADIVEFTLVDARGEVQTCSRHEKSDLFRLAIGGYGLFGVIATIRLRLQRRQKVERVVKVIEVDELMSAFAERIASGFTYGDFQFAIDPAAEDFLREGVFSCYRPVDLETPIAAEQRALTLDDWRLLLLLGHVDKRKAVDLYTAHYLGTDRQIYWSDSHQMAEYIDDYHLALDAHLGSDVPATEVITELYVPRERLSAFLADVRADFRENAVDLVYGTIRLIERDDESFLAWATEAFACVIFNLHTVHSDEGIARAAAAFRRLIDHAIRHGGSYYLTYHRFAETRQVERCYPQFTEFLCRKRQFDPEERFQSDWYRHVRDLFAECAPDPELV